MGAQSIRPVQANHTSLPLVTQPGGDKFSARRIALIAIPILISLASFLFLTATISCVITAVVTVGAFIYNKSHSAAPLEPPLSNAPSNETTQLPSEPVPSTKPPKPFAPSILKPKTPGIIKISNAVVSTRGKSSLKPSATNRVGAKPSTEGNLLPSHRLTPFSQTPLITKTPIVVAPVSTKGKSSLKPTATKPLNIEPSTEANPLPSHRLTPFSQTPEVTKTPSVVAAMSTKSKSSLKPSATKPLNIEPSVKGNPFPSHRLTPHALTPGVTKTIPPSTSANNRSLQPLSTPHLLGPQSKPRTPSLKKIQLRTTRMGNYPPTVHLVFETSHDRELFYNTYGSPFSKCFQVTAKDTPTQTAMHIYWKGQAKDLSNTANTLNILKEIFGEDVIKEKCRIPDFLDRSLLPEWMRTKHRTPS